MTRQLRQPTEPVKIGQKGEQRKRGRKPKPGNYSSDSSSDEFDGPEKYERGSGREREREE